MSENHSIPTNRKFIDITGQTFSLLKVVCYGGKQKGRHRWRCVCDCGNEKVVRTDALKSGHTKSCGCRQYPGTHGKRYSPEYGVWHSMIQRCTNPNDKSYHNYGGRGISVCERWLKFANFYADMGDRPTKDHTLERIENDVGIYEPINCCWATWEQQVRNKRNNRFLEFNGKRLILADWITLTGIPESTIRRRLDAGLPLEKVFS